MSVTVASSSSRAKTSFLRELSTSSRRWQIRARGEERRGDGGCIREGGRGNPLRAEFNHGCKMGDRYWQNHLIKWAQRAINGLV